MTKKQKIQLVVDDLDTIETYLFKLANFIEKNQKDGDSVGFGSLFENQEYSTKIDNLEKENSILNAKILEYEALLREANLAIKESIKDMKALKIGK